MKLLLISLLLLGSVASFGQQEPESNHNFVVVYVETGDSAAVKAFTQEMLSYSNKVVDVKYEWTTAEFTVVYTDLMRDDTIFQILLQYFRDIKKVRGTFIPETY